ncbi:MAG: ankyrin repeat domain-containing protein [Synergistaceae bacterium]|nr:ankyrin repeat domain-containing protein [Synergistaceae bacterium]
MAKLKFYLNVEDKKLRTLDDLRENFFADSVLAHYQSGKLAQWLDVWEYKNELEQVRAIQATGAREILTELCRIFGIEADIDDFDTNMPLKDYLEEKKAAVLNKEIEKEKAAEIQRKMEEEKEREREAEIRRKAEEERKAAALREEMGRKIKAATSTVNMRFFENWIRGRDDIRKKVNKWIPLMPPLMVAITNGDDYVVLTLLLEGADANAVVVNEDYSRSALMLASIGNNAEIVKTLIDFGANVNYKDNIGWTALTLATSYGKNPKIVTTLLDSGANVNVKDNDNDTVLINAVHYNDNIEIIKLLLQSGADVNAKNDSGRTALDKAENEKVKNAIIEAGGQYGPGESLGDIFGGFIGAFFN